MFFCGAGPNSKRSLLGRVTDAVSSVIGASDGGAAAGHGHARGSNAQHHQEQHLLVMPLASPELRIEEQERRSRSPRVRRPSRHARRSRSRSRSGASGTGRRHDSVVSNGGSGIIGIGLGLGLGHARLPRASGHKQRSPPGIGFRQASAASAAAAGLASHNAVAVGTPTSNSGASKVSSTSVSSSREAVKHLHKVQEMTEGKTSATFATMIVHSDDEEENGDNAGRMNGNRIKQEQAKRLLTNDYFALNFGKIQRSLAAAAAKGDRHCFISHEECEAFGRHYSRYDETTGMHRLVSELQERGYKVEWRPTNMAQEEYQLYVEWSSHF